MDLATPAQDQQKSIGRLTRLMARSLSIVWQSARTPFLSPDWAAATERHCPRAADPCSAAGFDSRAGNLGQHWRSLPLVQPVLLLAGLTAVTAVIASVQVGLGRYASELVVAVMWKRVLRVATRVDLRKFESARFYDRLQRVQANALTRPYQITHGLVATVGCSGRKRCVSDRNCVGASRVAAAAFGRRRPGTADEQAAEPAGVGVPGSADAFDALADIPESGTDRPGRGQGGAGVRPRAQLRHPPEHVVCRLPS